MAKRMLALLFIATMMLALGGCKKTKILHCDACGAEVEVEHDSNMEEDWIIYCAPCNEELFEGDPLLDPN